MADDEASVLPPQLTSENWLKIRKHEVNVGFLKVLVGTTLVGVLGVFIPGIIQWWSIGLEQRKAEFQIAIETAKTRREFVSEYFSTAISEDIELRIRFAEYFAQVSDSDTKSEWQAYASLLNGKRDEVRDRIDRLEAEARKIIARTSKEISIDDQIRLAETERRLEWLYREIGYVERGRSVVPSVSEAASSISKSPDVVGNYAAFLLLDVDSLKELASENAQISRAPASLAKIMTLYIAFEDLRDGKVALDERVLISTNATNEPPSKLGVAAGEYVQFEDLLEASAIKSANDAATALAERLSGTEEAFVHRMNETAARLGMEDTSFANANGLTQSGMVSTGRDLALLMARLYRDFPDRFEMLSAYTADAHGRTISNTAIRLYESDERVLGAKTGYTVEAGFNVAFIARHKGRLISGVVLGSTSTASRNAAVSRLLDDL